MLAGGGLLFLTDPLLPLLRQQAGVEVDPSDGVPAMQAIRSVFYVIVATRLLLGPERGRRMLSRKPLLWSLVGLSLVSIVWSVAPDVTLRRGLAFFGATLFGAYLAAAYSPRELQKILAWALAAALVSSVLIAIAAPSYGISTGTDAGAWRGIYAHKNNLGRIMALGTVLFASLALNELRTRRYTAALCVASLIVALLSRSASSLVVIAVMMLLSLTLRLMRLKASLGVTLFAMGLAVSILTSLWIVADPGRATSLISRDTTLTGRTELWGSVVDKIMNRPLLGYGYSAFWLGPGSNSESSSLSTSWEATHAHNGFLDLALDLGILGVALFMALYMLAIFRATRSMRQPGIAHDSWPLLYLVFLFIYNLSESSLARPNSMFWALFASLVLSEGSDARRQFRVDALVRQPTTSRGYP